MGGWPKISARIDLGADPAATLPLAGSLLLHKARIPMLAVLRANEASHLHSLAVQMRPVLECAGQVVFIFYTTIIAPDLLMPLESTMEAFGHRLNADFCQTLRRTTRGQISREKLRDMATQAQAAALPQSRGSRAFFKGPPTPWLWIRLCTDRERSHLLLHLWPRVFWSVRVLPRKQLIPGQRPRRWF